MNLRPVIVTVLALFAATPLVEAGDLCRGGRSRHITGNDATQPIARVPRKRTPAAPAIRVHPLRGKYPFVGKRRTPKRTYL